MIDNSGSMDEEEARIQDNLDPAMPTNILICPNACATLEADPTGVIDVAFGCGTIVE